MILPLTVLLISSGFSLAFDDEFDDQVTIPEASLATLNASLITCTAFCAHSINGSNHGVTGCYEHCLHTPNSDEDNPPQPPTLTPNGDFTFTAEKICQSDTEMILKILVDPLKKSPSFGTSGLYAIEVSSNAHSFIYLSKQPTILIEHLTPQTEYAIAGFVLSLTQRIELIADAKFSTLAKNFLPASVTNISNVSFELHGERLTAFFNWQVPPQRDCFYQVMWHADDDSSFPETGAVTITDDQLTTLQQMNIAELRFGVRYQLAIRGRSSRKADYEVGPLLWMDLITPTCVEWSGHDLDLCPPETPQKLIVSKIDYLPLLDHYDVTVSWKEPKKQPQNYTIMLIDIDLPDAPHLAVSKNTTLGTATTFSFTSVKLIGKLFEVALVANSRGGASHEAVVTHFFDKLNGRAAVSSHRMLKNVQLLILILIPLALLTGVSLFSYHVYLKRKKLFILEDTCQYSTSLNGGGEETLEGRLRLLRIPIDDHMEVKREAIELLGDLGEGEFGLVKLGQLRGQFGGNQIVAIKMLKETAKVQEMIEFRKEMDMMKSVGVHRNIVSIVGHYTHDVKELMLLTEYCPRGNLLNYLRNAWAVIKSSECMQEMNNVDEMYQEIDYDNGVENKCYQMTLITPTRVDLLNMALQIASGMEYLSKNRVIHRDLAARNVLLCDDLTAKISDFGLSRDIYQNNIYRKKSHGKLPIRWMAVESHSHQIYTSQSDVWSYGILLYELMTYGAQPYASVSIEAVPGLLASGYRMERPENCNEFVYDLMLACWDENPNKRPQFSAIVQEMQKIIEGTVAEEENSMRAGYNGAVISQCIMDVFD